MTTSAEILEIPKCSVCSQPHSYTLEVERATVMGMRLEPMEDSGPVRFTKLFTCPVQDKTFQAAFTLWGSPGDKITSISNGGMIDAEPL